jgi:uncharacterized oligopeptide transporter (OPT) family protein
MIGLLTIAILIPLMPTAARADHGGALRSSGMSPVATALLWAGAVILIGLTVIAIVTLWTRRRSPPPES